MNNEHDNHNHNHLHNNIRKTVLEKIESGDIYMRSRGYFIAKIALVIIVSLLILLTSAFFVSFISFSLRVSGRFVLLGFGWQGLKAFIMTFPWGLFLIDLVLVVVLERLIRTFKFGYRSPFIYVIGSLVIVVVITGIAIDDTPVHSTLWHVEMGAHKSVGAPAFFGLGSMYDSVRQPPHEEGVFRGTIVFMDIATPGGPPYFILKSDDSDDDIDNVTTSGPIVSKVWKIFLPPGVSIGTADTISLGDEVLVAGDVVPDGVHAYGIQKILDSDTF